MEGRRPSHPSASAPPHPASSGPPRRCAVPLPVKAKPVEPRLETRRYPDPPPHRARPCELVGCTPSRYHPKLSCGPATMRRLRARPTYKPHRSPRRGPAAQPQLHQGRQGRRHGNLRDPHLRFPPTVVRIIPHNQARRAKHAPAAKPAGSSAACAESKTKSGVYPAKLHAGRAATEHSLPHRRIPYPTSPAESTNQQPRLRPQKAQTGQDPKVQPRPDPCFFRVIRVKPSSAEGPQTYRFD